MSGGHWNYLQEKFDEAIEGNAILDSTLRVMGQIEHELDWGFSGDTCTACAERRVLAALPVFFDSDGRYSQGALAVLRDREAVENICGRCLDLMPGWTRKGGARPTLAEIEQEQIRRSQ